MTAKSLSAVDRGDIEALIGVPESKTLEYKREMPAKDKEGITKLLASVTSFANTGGGDLLIGITEDHGLAAAIAGVQCADPETERLRLLHLLKDHAEPRIPGIELTTIPCDDDRVVILIRTPRSWLAPHRVKTDNKFYGRTSAGKYPLDVAEIRNAFLLSDVAGARLRHFHTDRLLKIISDETPIPLRPGARVILHAVSLPALGEHQRLDVVELLAEGTTMPFPFGQQGSGNQFAFNLDGCLAWTGTDGPTDAYTQISRLGALEGVLVLAADNNGISYLRIEAFEYRLVAALKNYLRLLPELGMSFPVTIFLALTGMTHCEFRYSANIGGDAYFRAGPLREDTINLPDVLLLDDKNLPAALALPLSALWNAFGQRRSVPTAR